ncbi:hypothetical protein IWQ62_006842, partial [Dispira parvispora]
STIRLSSPVWRRRWTRQISTRNLHRKFRLIRWRTTVICLKLPKNNLSGLLTKGTVGPCPWLRVLGLDSVVVWV